MDILVIGGSYFAGKCFVNMAKEKHSITVFNRGTSPLETNDIVEIYGDRHNEDSLKQLAGKHYDVVVDFCGYQEGDIDFFLTKSNIKLSQYIFLSTVDACIHGSGLILDEKAPYEERNIAGPEGDYIRGKVALEKELIRTSKGTGFKYTIIRPAFIYGPGNYAPREGIYFHWIRTAHQVIHPADATGEFQFVYVGDVAKAILAAIGENAAENEVFSLASEEVLTYDKYVEIMGRVVDEPFELVKVSVSDIMEKGIPLPFPLTKEESNLYDGSKVKVLLGEYKGLEEGLKETLILQN